MPSVAAWAYSIVNAGAQTVVRKAAVESKVVLLVLVFCWYFESRMVFLIQCNKWKQLGI
jgi:hypothetical protein